MASIKLTGDTSGEITISAPAVAGTNTITLPASTGEILTTSNQSTNTPLCRVRQSSSTALSDNVIKKVEFDTVDFESGVTFDTTNHRFTVPSGANGYYMINAMVSLDAQTNSDLSQASAYIYKNNSQEGKYNNFSANNNDNRRITLNLCQIVSLVATDYIEIFAKIDDNGLSTACQVNVNFTELSIHKLIT